MHRSTWIAITDTQRLAVSYGMLCPECRRQKMLQGVLVYNDREALGWIRQQYRRS